MKPIKDKDLELLQGMPEEIKNVLRLRRQVECFNITDRAVWYDGLTSEQKQEVQKWRKAWLDVTDTMTIPKKPYWL